MRDKEQNERVLTKFLYATGRSLQTFQRGLLVVLILGYASAQEIVGPPSGPYVRVHGEATISVQPDRAQLGVSTQDATAKGATDLNAKQSKAVIDQLRSAFPDANLKTVNFSVNPDYRYPKEGGPPQTLGYTANNTIRFDTVEVSTIQRITDVAARAGANNVNRLNFMLSDEGAVRAQALAKAAQQAKASAEALAASLSLKLDGVLRIEEIQPVIISPAREVELSVSKGKDTPGPPVEPGNVDVHANINVTYALGRR